MNIIEAVESLKQGKAIQRTGWGNAKIKAVKAEIKSLKKDSGEQISASAQAYIQQAQVRVQTRLAALSASAEETSSLQTAQASNLQVKTNHKKPVAK